MPLGRGQPCRSAYQDIQFFARDAIALCERRSAAAIRVTGAPLIAICRKRWSSAAVQYLFRRLYIGGQRLAK